MGPKPENPWMQAAVPGYMGMDPLGLKGIWKGPNAPTMPGYTEAAQQAAAANMANAQFALGQNRANQYNPFGSLVWQQGPDGQWSQTTSFSPQQQQLFDVSQQGKLNMMNQAMPEFGANRESVMKAMMGRSNEAIAKDRAQMESQLAAQGIPRNSPAFDTEMARFDRRLTDAQQQAEAAATGQAATEYGSMLAGRGQQMGMYNMFSPQMPQFQNYAQMGNVLGPDYLGATKLQGDFSMGQYNADVAANNATKQGLFNLGGAAIGAFSDIRLKHSLERIGELASGIPVYIFSYIGSTARIIGVMAQDVLKVIPEAVITTPSGFYAVNYGMLK